MAHLVKRDAGGDVVVFDTETGKNAAQGFETFEEAEQWVREQGSPVLPNPDE